MCCFSIESPVVSTLRLLMWSSIQCEREWMSDNQQQSKTSRGHKWRKKKKKLRKVILWNFNFRIRWISVVDVFDLVAMQWVWVWVCRKVYYGDDVHQQSRRSVCIVIRVHLCVLYWVLHFVLFSVRSRVTHALTSPIVSQCLFWTRIENKCHFENLPRMNRHTCAHIYALASAYKDQAIDNKLHNFEFIREIEINFNNFRFHPRAIPRCASRNDTRIMSQHRARARARKTNK